MTRRAALALVLAAAAPSVTAQAGPSEGLMLGAPMTVLVASGTGDGTSALDPARLHAKPVGYRAFTPDAAPVDPSSPLFTSAALFGDGVSAPDFEVNALSMGLDPLPFTQPAGGVSMVSLAGTVPWGMLTFSVDRDCHGEPGSRLRFEDTNAGGAAADLFSYLLPGSELAFPYTDIYPVDTVQRSVDSLQMGLSSGPAEGEIIAMDFMIGLYDAADPLLDFLPEQPSVFFSIAHDSIFPPGGGPSSVDPAWFGGPALMSSASILVTTWNSAGGFWSEPTVFLHSFELGLAVDDDIDALSVDEAACKALFSIRPTSGSSLAEQLQVVDWCLEGGVAVGNLSVDIGGSVQSVASRLGLAPSDNVDSVCTEDPGGQGSALPLSFGVPSGQIKPTLTLAASMFRDRAESGPSVSIMVEGLPKAGPPRVLGLYIGFPTVPGATLLFPAVYSSLVGMGNAASERTVTFTHPDIGNYYGGLSLDVFWVIHGAGQPIECSATLQLKL